jgi:hypothetical protein
VGSTQACPDSANDAEFITSDADPELPADLVVIDDFITKTLFLVPPARPSTGARVMAPSTAGSLQRVGLVASCSWTSVGYDASRTDSKASGSSSSPPILVWTTDPTATG